MIDDAALATTELAMSCRIAPLKNVVGDIGGIISGYGSELVSAFYPPLVSRKVEVALNELIQNVLSNFIDGDSGITIDMRIVDQNLTVRVSSVATLEQFLTVKSVVESLKSAANPKELLKTTIRERRKDRQQGGVGLLRLVAENRFDLDAKFEGSVLAVESHIALGGLL